jgi:hypothetical protein
MWWMSVASRPPGAVLAAMWAFTWLCLAVGQAAAAGPPAPASKDEGSQQATPARAPSYRWKDSRGREHVSNLPRSAFRADGGLVPRYHPNQPGAQYPAMLEALRARQLALDAAAHEATEKAAAEAARAALPDPASSAASLPKRRMSLSELLELEKNGGRPVAAPAP